MRVAVVVPTITGREESLQRTLDAYRATLAGIDYELVVPRNRSMWPVACNEAVELLAHDPPDLVHFGADDLVPLHQWLEPCLPILEAGELPAPRVWNFRKEPCATPGMPADWAPTQDHDGPAGSLTYFTRVPILTWEMVERIGPWPEIVYYSDVWISQKARHVGGWETRVVAGYDFVHHWHQTGRLADEGELAHTEFQRLLEEFA